MLRDRAFHREIEAAVTAAEATTSAEIVVTMARASGAYRDTDYLAGSLFAGAGLVVMLFAPFTITPILVVPYVAALWVLGAVIAGRVGPLRRLLTSAARRREQARCAAIAAFYEEGVSATRERNGMIIYISLFEGAVEILGDLGIDGKVPRAEWNRVRHDLLGASAKDKPAAILRAIEACGEILKAPFPPAPVNPDEIPNRPRIRL